MGRPFVHVKANNDNRPARGSNLEEMPVRPTGKKESVTDTALQLAEVLPVAAAELA